MSKNYLLPTRTNQRYLLKGNCVRFVFSFVFLFLRLKLLLFENVGLIFSMFSYFTFLM